jgi:predicted dehydrogenase
MPTTPNQHRRKFLQAAGSAAAATLLPCSILKADDASLPKDGPRFGVIGLRNQGWFITKQAIDAGANIVALADIDATILAEITDRLVTGRDPIAEEKRKIAAEEAKKEGKPFDETDFKKHIIKKPDTYKDYRKILERDDIDAVMIATPDHWHAKIAIEAMLAGKHVYCEKPLTHTIAEGKLIEKVVAQTGRIFQVGTMQRSSPLFLKAVALVRSGRIGKIQKVTCGLNSFSPSPELPIADVPKGLDWDFWLGPAPKVPYRALPEMREGYGSGVPLYSNGHYSFRNWHEYSGGRMTDWGAHHVDIANWAIGASETGPSKITPINFKLACEHKDGIPVVDNRYNSVTEFNVKVDMPDDVEMLITSDGDNGILFEGSEGRFFVNRGKITGKPVEDLAENPLPEDALEQVYGGPLNENHALNFINAVNANKNPISDVWSHNRMLEICHLANIAMRLDRPLAWDPVKREIVGDDQASGFLSREYRSGYEIEM